MNNITLIGTNKCKCNICGFIWNQKPRKDRSMSCPNCHPSEHGSSKGECELYDILLTTKLKIIHNDREQLNGKELDIYFPDFKFAIEYDGSYWHSSEKDELKNKLCKEKHIRLLRVNDKEFTKNKERIINQVLTILKEYSPNIEIHYELIKDVVRVSGKCRKIVCTDTGEVFDNYIILSKKFNCKYPSCITNVCNGTFNNYNGYHFKWYGEKYEPTKVGFAYKTSHIKCVETGEVFNGISFLRKNGVTAINDCLQGKQKTTCGLHWEKTDSETTDCSKTLQIIKENKMKDSIITSKSKEVICENTNEIFSSVSEAAKHFGISRQNVFRVCEGKFKQTKGYKFKYKYK